ncbi:hypothetical protein PF007_g30580 [Phytophthora fragariae]|uniref:Uncharacterized protein n=2 Tax=Phytophthora fragariae TaxID=53985 RepID=A0A6A3PSR7_9STRA|nr:hypothetical protein PF007_g30580 [Phytophthora fragariae]
MQQKEEPPGGEVPGPPPPEVINMCQLSQGDEDSYMLEQIAGGKRRPEAEAESPDSDGDDSPDLDSIKMTRNPDARVKDNEDEEKTETNQPSPAIKEESVMEDETANSQDDNPPQFDDSDAVVLTFAEMLNYLHEEMKDLDNQAAKEVESANEYMQSMFAQVFTSHPAETLDDSKSQYPQLNEAEIEALLRLFIQDRKEGRADARKWKGRLYDITRAIYKSRRSLIEVVEHRITTAQVTMQPMTNMWAIRAAEHAPSNAVQDVDMSDDSTSMFRFQSSTYSPEEVDALRRLCETAYGFPTQLRKPTEMETRIIKGLVEGTILCSKLPDFLKRICSNESLRKIQNTIQAQVEGDLIIKLQPEFPVYPDFQTEARLVSNITMGLENGRHDKQKVIALLQAAKQVYYDRKVHAVHIIFWTRELAAKWSREVKTLPFRNRTFPLVNEHPEDTHTSSQGPVDTEVVWRRQVGADGVKNENPRDRYHVRLLNVSRCMDEAAIDAYIRQQFHGIYTTWQEPSSGSQTMQTDTWDIFFKWPGCPSFLSGKRFVNWDGVKILVHHASNGCNQGYASLSRQLKLPIWNDENLPSPV